MRAIFRRRDFGERLGIILMLLIPIIIVGVVLFFVLKTDYAEGFNFEAAKDGSGYILVKYDGDEEVVEIPEKHLGKPVVAIGSEAFKNNSELETVRIPASVKTIESKAFEGCVKLLDVNLKSGTTTIEEDAFLNCYYIAYLYLPDTLTCIEPGAFRGCIRVAYIFVDEGNKTYHAAGNCIIETETKTLVLGGFNSVIPTDGSVTRIGEKAFIENAKMSTITIPECITEIGEDAFRDCYMATQITIPKSVTKIDDYAFYGCLNVSSVIYQGTSEEWDKIEIGDRNINFKGVIRYFQPDGE